MPNLNENDQVLLESCMDEIRNVVGDTVSERQLVETIIKYEFDCAKSLDAILNNTKDAPVTSTSSTPSAVPMETGNQLDRSLCQFSYRTIYNQVKTISYFHIDMFILPI